jgi:hypothetical protein
MHARPLNGHDVSQLGPVFLSPLHWHCHYSPPADNIESDISSCNHQQHQKDSFFPLQPCLLGAVFVTHRHAHMRACSLHRCVYRRACSLHRRAPVHTCLLYRRAPTRAYSPYRRTQVRAYQTHRRALVRACSTHRRALRACLKFSQPHTMHVYLVDRHARMCAYHPIARVCGAQTP